MNEETQVAPDDAEISVEQSMSVDEQLKAVIVEFKRALERISDLEAKMDAGQLIGRPDAIVLHAARVAHDVSRVLGDNSQPSWSEAPEWQRRSALLGVRAIQANPGITSAQQHALWRAQMVSDGWVYGDAKDVEKKTHPCLVPYDELPDEQQVKAVLSAAAVRAVLGA